MKLDEGKFVISGAGNGMGAHFTKRLLEAGARVVAGDVDEKGLNKLREECSPWGQRLETKALDVSDDSSIELFIDWADTKLGGLNGVISNAGILRDALLVKKERDTGEITKLTREQWQRVIDVNLTGATFFVRDAVVKMMTNKTPGVVISMSSIARHGNRGQSNYVAAKSALAANTVTWAKEFGRYGIRVGAIAPGMVETPMTANMNPKAREMLVKAVPCGRIGTPDDIWQGVKFIVECDYFSGRVLDIDGGLGM